MKATTPSEVFLGLAAAVLTYIVTAIILGGWIAVAVKTYRYLLD
jgi:hypothetical protein